jgi:peptide-methionine (S)-S-oxide reductase
LLEKEQHVDGQLATFGAGCFSGVEAAFRRVAGIYSAAVDFFGGTVRSPSADDE